MKIQGSTLSLLLKLYDWSAGEEGGTTSVEVKFVDICRNADDEGSSLDCN